MKTALIVFGTRPEAIKMAPIIRAFQQSEVIRPVTCATAQHRNLLDQVNQFFGIVPDFDLDLMQNNQDLFDVTANCLLRIRRVFEEVKPDVVLVQGDTATTCATALGAFYRKIPVAHVEAGLRTHDKYSPFPEEMNRVMVTRIADFHFAPTVRAIENLVAENVFEDTIYLTGNTSVDALIWASAQKIHAPALANLYRGRKMVLMTAHRRENFGEPLRAIFHAIRQYCMRNPDIHIVYPVHPNPNVKSVAYQILGNLSNVSLIDPLDYCDLIFLLKECQFVLTDSGGIQEEAPSLGKPVLVLRDTTERPEAIEAGCAETVGHDPSLILDRMQKLSESDSDLYQRMSRAANPFGDGTAARRILSILEESLASEEELPTRHIRRPDPVVAPVAFNYVN